MWNRSGLPATGGQIAYLAVWCLCIGAVSSGCSDGSSPNAIATKPDTNASAPPDQPTTSELVDPLVPPIELSDHDKALPILEMSTAADSRFSRRSIFSSDPRARFEAHGEQVCASGCAASRHPTPELKVAAFQKLMAAYRLEPMDSTSPALESLLFYGRQTQQLIRQHGTTSLDAARAEFLAQELSRTHATVALRIVDQQGVVRTHMPSTRVPLDRRHVFDMENTDLPPLITSGTVKRVGLHHLWTRL